MNLSVNANVVSNAYNKANTEKVNNEKSKDKAAKTESGSKNTNADAVSVDISSKSKKAYEVDEAQVKKLLEQSKKQQNDFMEMIRKMFTNQSKKADQADLIQLEFKDINKDLISSLELDDADILKAREDVSEDGYYGVKQTSERILDFAKAISGGNPSKIGLLKDAVLKGYKAAEKQWGDELPTICQDTYDAVMKGFEEWENESKEAEETAE